MASEVVVLSVLTVGSALLGDQLLQAVFIYGELWHRISSRSRMKLEELVSS